MRLELIIGFLVAGTAAAATARLPVPKTRPEPNRVMVVDGSPVHDVGALLLHTSNWGMVGSLPGSGFPFSDAPSAEWPAGSDVEYLFVGGLWVGALKNGVPAISTAALDFEFRPTPDPVDVVYRTAEGAEWGSRLPAATADDDYDGAVDEDPLDGHDNDGDGLVDEDFAAISSQMFSRWYTDDQEATINALPQHNPLNITVREHSYQWDDPDFDDFVGFDYEIANTGSSLLEEVYVGVFLDCDVGMRADVDYWTDDAVDFKSVRTAEFPVDYAYMYDPDGDAGAATGYFGVAFLDHPTDPTGQSAPTQVGMSLFTVLEPADPNWPGGGIDPGRTDPDDYRFIAMAGPFAELPPGETMQFSVALVATPRDGNFENVVNAATLYRGRFFDVDGDPNTGDDGKEYQAHWWLPSQPDPIEPIIARMDFTPRTFSLRYPTASPTRADVTLPAGYSAHNLHPGVLLNGTIPGSIETITDDEHFTAVFPPDALLSIPVEDGTIEARVTFAVRGVPFLAVDRVRVIETARAPRVSLAPNPFYPSVGITFELENPGDVALDIYAADGTIVRRLRPGAFPIGEHETQWDGRDDRGVEVPSGIYFCRLQTGGFSVTQKMALIK